MLRKQEESDNQERRRKEKEQVATASSSSTPSFFQSRASRRSRPKSSRKLARPVKMREKQNGVRLPKLSHKTPAIKAHAPRSGQSVPDSRGRAEENSDPDEDLAQQATDGNAR
jgi:hypothetical protein